MKAQHRYIFQLVLQLREDMGNGEYWNRIDDLMVRGQPALPLNHSHPITVTDDSSNGTVLTGLIPEVVATADVGLASTASPDST